MSFIWLCVTWFIGSIAGIFFLISPLIVLFFGIPFSIKLKTRGILRGYSVIISYVVSAVCLPCIFAVITYGVHAWLPKQMIGYWIGLGITLVLGLGRIGANQTNVQEYIESNAAHLDLTRLQEELGLTIQEEKWLNNGCYGWYPQHILR